jgi:hypothetical protein
VEWMKEILFPAGNRTPAIQSVARRFPYLKNAEAFLLYFAKNRRRKLTERV